MHYILYRGANYIVIYRWALFKEYQVGSFLQRYTFAPKLAEKYVCIAKNCVCAQTCIPVRMRTHARTHALLKTFLLYHLVILPCYSRQVTVAHPFEVLEAPIWQ